MSEEAGVQRAPIPISVLVVEDEESTRKLCADVAESCGMRSSRPLEGGKIKSVIMISTALFSSR